MKNILLFLLLLLADTVFAANPTFGSFNTNQFNVNASANTIAGNTNPANPQSLVTQTQLVAQIGRQVGPLGSNYILGTDGTGTGTLLFSPVLEDVLNIGAGGAAGTFSFAPGPANAWMDFTFAPNTISPLHFHITGDPYWTGAAHGSGAFLTDLPINVTNASPGVAGKISPIASSNSPTFSLKSLSAGAGINLNDNGTDVVFSASGNAGVDYSLVYTSPYLNNSNFNIDFSSPAQVLNTPTNLIVFTYATNWGLANTSRVANIFIQWTNFGRLVYFTGAATNWHVSPSIWYVPPGYGARLQASVFGQLDTNVMVTTFIDSFPSGSNTTASFNPTNVYPSATKLWLDASRLVFQDEAALTPVQNGSVVRAWSDLSRFTTGVSNNNSLAMTIQYQAPQSGPYNVPNMAYSPGNTWMQSPAFGSLGPPMWAFVMFYGRNMGTVLDCVGTRFAVQPGESGQSMSFFSGSGLSANGQANVSWVLFAFFSNSPNSIMRTNGVQANTGITGNPAATSWLVGSDNSKTAGQGTANIAEVLILQTNLTAVQLTNVESYFFRKYPFWNPPTVQ